LSVGHGSRRQAPNASEGDVPKVATTAKTGKKPSSAVAGLNSDAPEAAQPETMQPWLGQRLRRLRHLCGYSLEDVATATNISISFLSVVESGKSDIAISRLMKLVRLYDASVLEVLEQGSGDRVVMRKGMATRFTSDEENVEVEVLLPGRLRRMQPSVFNWPPGEGHRADVVVDGEVFVFVLSGAVTVHFEDGEDLALASGDSAYFSGNTPHRFANPGNRKARVLSCTSSPIVAGGI
jgi:transcriptional regulator with XRE-family HTH domain